MPRAKPASGQLKRLRGNPLRFKRKQGLHILRGVSRRLHLCFLSIERGRMLLQEQARLPICAEGTPWSART